MDGASPRSKGNRQHATSGIFPRRFNEDRMRLVCYVVGRWAEAMSVLGKRPASDGPLPDQSRQVLLDFGRDVAPESSEMEGSADGPDQPPTPGVRSLLPLWLHVGLEDLRGSLLLQTAKNIDAIQLQWELASRDECREGGWMSHFGEQWEVWKIQLRFGVSGLFR